METKLWVRHTFMAVAAFGLSAPAVSAQVGDQVVSSGFDLASKLSLGVAFDCANSPGPIVTFADGQIAVGAVSGQLVFSNNLELTNVTDPGVLVEAAVLLDFGTQIQIPKQPSRPADYYGSPLNGTGVGGNPWIYAELSDGVGNALRKLDGSTLGPILLGRCKQGAAVIDVGFFQPVIAAAMIHHDDTDNCYNNPGPSISITGGIITFGGVHVRVIFTNNARFTHAALDDAIVDFAIISRNGIVNVPGEPVLRGAGDSSHVWFQFLNDGKPVGTYPGFYLGRCVQDLSGR